MAEGPRRRLAAIMFTDMVGYSSLTQNDEAGALRMLDEHNRLLRPIFPRYHGTEVKAIGDSFLVEFDSALEAVNCAIEIQRCLSRRNLSAAPAGPIQVRIGIHLGDVVHSEGDVFGDAVNIASRIEPLADPEGICISAPVLDQVRGKLGAGYDRVPSSGMKNLVHPVDVYQVRWDRDDAPLQGGEPSPLRGHRLAVSPFANMSTDSQDEFLADGLTEELIAETARIPDCQVIARTSVMRYKASPKGIREVGRDLNVDVALEGSVRRSGQRVRITAQLIDAKSEAHLWTERYDRELTDIFELQSEIALRVAAALSVKLEPHHREAIRRTPTSNLAAYELYLKGRQLWWLSGEQNYRAAIRHFEQAIALDPDFALAYCGLADSHALLGNHGYDPLEGALRAVETAARHAIQLDPKLGDAYVSLAPVLYNRYDWQGAETELRRAIQLGPNNVLGHYWYAVAVAVLGKLSEALEHARIAAALDPLSRQAVLSPVPFLYLLRDYAGAIEYMDRVEARIGGRSEIYHGLCELQLGRTESALGHILKSALGPMENAPSRRAHLAIAYARAGKDEEFQRLFDKLLADARSGRVPAGTVASVFAAVGKNDEAFEWFDRAFVEKTVLGVEDLKVDPLLDGLRSDARYPALLRRFNLPP